MKRDILPGLFLLLIVPTVWSQCQDTPLSLTLSYPTDIELPSQAIDGGLYRMNLFCEWELSSNREGLQLEFVTFDLQDSPNCIDDYLEIYTGSGETEERVDRWCGSEYPDYIVMSRGRIVFRSDDRVAASGFSIRVKFTMFRSFQNVHFPITAVERPQFLYAPFYGEIIGGETLSFDWKLTASDPNMVLQIDYQSVCEKNTHTVQVLQFNANFTVPLTSDLLDHRCDYPFHDVVVSHVPHVLIRVKTDQTGTNKRFRLAISAAKNYTAECSEDGRVHAVPVTEYPQYLLVPYYHPTRTSPVVKSCRWHVTTDLTDHVVAMEMMVYDPPPMAMCTDTHVSVYNGADNSSMKVVSACANSDRFSAVESPEMFIDIHIRVYLFDTNPSKKGFLMKIYAIKMCEEDKLHTLVAGGDISYAVLNYNVGPECTWRVQAGDVKHIKMVDVGVETAGGPRFDNPVQGCVQHNQTYLQVFRAWTTLSQFQVSPMCPATNAQDYRVYGTTVYLPTHTSTVMPRMSQTVYYYATKGICDSEGVTTLEATLTTQSLFSPNYPNTFWPYEHCRWRFHSFSPYYDVAFRVLSFTSENSGIISCTTSQNHIVFYDGFSSNSTRLIMRCAGLGTDSISSMGRYVYAEFKSFSDNRGKFEILYKAVRSDSSCNKELQAAPTAQNLSSPGFPTGAASNADCWWRILVQSEDDVVFVKVLQTDMYQTMVYSECQENYVQAFDGKDSSEGLIVKWCGTQTPSFISTGKYMFLEFKTDSYNKNKGFLLSYNSTKASITRCGSALTAFDYVSFLASPNYPNNYKNHMDCQWNITASSLYNTIKIEVIDTELEYDCSFDNVSVYDGSLSGGTLLQTFCAHSKPTLQTTTRNMYIRFRSDSSRTHRGFRLKYYQTEDSPPSLVCNKRLTSRADAMYLESPGYPNIYPSNLHCWWIITSNDPSGRVLIEVLHSTLEYSYGCVDDYVSVLDGDREGRELGRFCGTQNPTYTSVERSVYILFKTNTDVNAQGFRLKYTTTKACVEGHVQDLAARTFPDFIESPDYPRNYPNDVSCMWRITTNISKYIQVTVLESDIESNENCGYDFMAAYDGYMDSSPSLDKWCGIRTPTFTSSGTVMFLKFRSDGSGTGKGFRLKYAGVNTGNYGSSSVSMKAGTVAGVVCGVFVVTAIMIAVVFIIVRHKHKNHNSDEDLTRRSRRTRRNWRLPQYQEEGPWEVNQVFYSQQSGDGIMSPPPYNLVVGVQVPNEPPPPYPAAEFDSSLKDDDDPAPPYQFEDTQGLDVNRVDLSSVTDPGQGTSSGTNSRTSGRNSAGNNAGKTETSPTSVTDRNTSTQPDQQSSSTTQPDQQSSSRSHPRPQPRPHPRPQPRPQRRPERRSDPQPLARLAQTSRAVSVDNLVPGEHPLSLAPLRSELPRQQMSPQTRAVSMSHLLTSDTPQSRGYDRHVSQSEMALNYAAASPQRQETDSRERHRQPLSERPKRNRPGRRPERPERQRDKETGGRGRTRSEPDFANPAPADDRPDRTSPPDRYVRNHNRNPTDHQSRPRGRRYNPRSEFENMKQRSRSCDNLHSDGLSLPNNTDHNPRWSVASEGYMNNSWSTSPTRPLGQERYNNPSVSRALDSPHRIRDTAVASCPVPRERGTSRSGPQRRDGQDGGSRWNLTQETQPKALDGHARSSHKGSRGNLTSEGERKYPEMEQVSGYARNIGNVILSEGHDGDGGRGQPTETSV